jgi:hypothetical protein
MLPSMILHRTRIELARKRSIFPFMSFVSELVTIITSSAAFISATSLMNRYIMRRSDESGDWKSRVTEKNTVVASCDVNFSPWVSKYKSLVIKMQHRFG